MVQGLGRFADGLAATALVATMFVTIVDVVGRYFLNAPLAGAFELTRVLMGLLVFSALPMVTARENHIIVELFVPILAGTPRRKAVQRSVVQLISAAVMGFIGFQVWRQAENLAQSGDRTPSLLLPLFPFVYYMAILGLVTTLIVVAIWYSYTALGRSPFKRRER